MRSKISFLVGGALGYVLGARAGQQRYEQIKTKSQQLWQSEPVQTKVSEATEAVKQAAPVVTEKVTEAAKHAGEAAKSKVTSSDSDTPGSSTDESGTTYTTNSTRAASQP